MICCVSVLLPVAAGLYLNVAGLRLSAAFILTLFIFHPKANVSNRPPVICTVIFKKCVVYSAVVWL